MADDKYAQGLAGLRALESNVAADAPAAMQGSDEQKDNSAEAAGADAEMVVQASDAPAAAGADAVIAVQVQTMAGNVVLDTELEGSVTVADLLERLVAGGKLQAENCRHELMNGNDIITREPGRQIGELLGPTAELTVASRPFYRLQSSVVAGAHTNNPQYFERLDVGTEDEVLRLISVCWFSISGEFQNVPPGRYRVFVEAAKAATRFNLHGNTMAVTAGGQNIKTWAPQTELTEDFQKFDMGEIEHKEFGKIKVQLDLRDGAWSSGFHLKAMYLG